MVNYFTGQPTNERGESSGNSRYRGQRYKRHRSSKERSLLFLGLILLVETALLVAVFVHMSVLEKENTDLRLSERKQAVELNALRPQMEKLQAEMAALTQSRLPGLHPLEFDKVIHLEQDYVRNIVFTVAGKDEEKNYEFKTTVHNNSLNLIHPQIDILFFDSVGIQIGLARIGVQKDGTPTLDMLDRGEIRTFSEKVALTDSAAPQYFRIRVYK